MQLATGDNRPLINDTVILNGNNNMYNVRVNGQSLETLQTSNMLGEFQVGVFTAPTSSGINNIYNSDINQTSTTHNGMSVANNSNVDSLNIYNTTITSSVSNLPGESLNVGSGVGNLRTSELNLFNSTVTTSNTTTSDNFSLAVGVLNNESGLLNISNTSITTTGTHLSFLVSVLNNSSIDNLGTITITGSTITANGNDILDSGSVAGVLNQATADHDSANANISQSTISVTSNNSNDNSLLYGIATVGKNSTMSIANSTINSAGDHGSVAGIGVGEPTATLNYQNILNSVNFSGTATGTPIQNNSGTLNGQGDNQCFVNGVSTPCQ
ncbi:MAG: uncharacterized protein K0S63_931 [Gammaproteobacteria bacterium]|jgi:hypothetical protein|nr:uncharacterized protein [Gammaproteobacteria bacterium]